jgi:hypothetical protein
MKKIALMLPVLAAAVAAEAQGNVEAMLNYAGIGPQTGPPIYSEIQSGGAGPVGWTFQPSTDIDVTALGAFAYVVPQVGSLEIGLWNASGVLLASQNVSAARSEVDQSYYQAILPVLLTAGDTYYIAAFSAAGTLDATVVTPGSGPNGSATMSPEIQLGTVAYNTNGPFAFPSTTEGNPGDAIIAPNFEFTPVPEPAAAGLLAFGMGGWLGWRRGRTKG